MNKEKPKILNEFSNYLLVSKSFSKETIKSYNIDLMLFFEFIKEYLKIKNEIKDFNKFILLQVKEADIIAFLIHCNYSRDNNPYTRQRKLSAIRCFYKWLLGTFPDGELHTNPTLGIGNIKKVVRLPKYLNLEDSKKIQKIFNNSNCKNPIRDNTILCVFLTTGIRVSELTSINIKDINFTKKVIRIVGKGNKERAVYLNNYCKQQLEHYISIRNKNKQTVNTNEALLLNDRGERFTRHGIYYICKKAFEYMDLGDRHYSPHTLRHTSATLLYMYVKKDTLLLKEFLGHDSIASTQIYTHIHNTDLKEAVAKNPLANFGLEDKEENEKEKVA